jgi:hypothetical protein
MSGKFPIRSDSYLCGPRAEEALDAAPFDFSPTEPGRARRVKPAGHRGAGPRQERPTMVASRIERCSLGGFRRQSRPTSLSAAWRGSGWHGRGSSDAHYPQCADRAAGEPAEQHGREGNCEHRHNGPSSAVRLVTFGHFFRSPRPNHRSIALQSARKIAAPRTSQVMPVLQVVDQPPALTKGRQDA